MIGDIISPRERLSRLSPNRWQSRLALCFIAAACILGLMLT
jgi:hypothetical protein